MTYFKVNVIITNDDLEVTFKVKVKVEVKVIILTPNHIAKVRMFNPYFLLKYLSYEKVT